VRICDRGQGAAEDAGSSHAVRVSPVKNVQEDSTSLSARRSVGRTRLQSEFPVRTGFRRDGHEGDAAIRAIKIRHVTSIAVTRYRNTAVFELSRKNRRPDLTWNLSEVDSPLQVSLNRIGRESSMNARVLLLILVSALFMAAWTGDQKVMQQAYARREAARDTLLASRQRLDSQPPPAIGNSGQASRSTVASERQTLPDTVPLPAGIASGRYRVVSGSGETMELQIDAPRGQCRSQFVMHDFYVTDDPSGHRWYLIRIADRMQD